jgi:hypothetical protein
MVFLNSHAFLACAEVSAIGATDIPEKIQGGGRQHKRGLALAHGKGVTLVLNWFN